MAAPEKPKPKPPTIKDFETWVEGRTGLAQRDFFDAWVTPYNLTPEQITALWGQVKKEVPKPPTPIPTKPPEKPPEKPKVPPEKPPEKPPPPPPPPTPKQPTVKPELIIARTPYPKWWKDSLNATIFITAPGSAILATVTGSLRLFVSTIVITVTGETVITFTFGSAGSSGPIYLGGENQPMGMVVAMGNSPAPCGAGSLSISATDPNEESPSIGGWATVFVEES